MYLAFSSLSTNLEPFFLQHYFAVDMAYKGIKNTAPKDAEVFMPVDAPSGLIIATVARDASAKL